MHRQEQPPKQQQQSPLTLASTGRSSKHHRNGQQGSETLVAALPEADPSGASIDCGGGARGCAAPAALLDDGTPAAAEASADVDSVRGLPSDGGVEAVLVSGMDGSAVGAKQGADECSDQGQGGAVVEEGGARQVQRPIGGFEGSGAEIGIVIADVAGDGFDQVHDCASGWTHVVRRRRRGAEQCASAEQRQSAGEALAGACTPSQSSSCSLCQSNDERGDTFSAGAEPHTHAGLELAAAFSDVSSSCVAHARGPHACAASRRERRKHSAPQGADHVEQCPESEQGWGVQCRAVCKRHTSSCWRADSSWDEFCTRWPVVAALDLRLGNFLGAQASSQRNRKVEKGLRAAFQRGCLFSY
eukprot:3078724-Pleurochrysis_carterae.AAC.1